MFRFCTNHLQGASGTLKTSSVASCVQACEYNVKNEYIKTLIIYNNPIPVAEWSKAWICSRSPAGIAGSNPAGGMDVCLL